MIRDKTESAKGEAVYRVDVQRTVNGRKMRAKASFRTREAAEKWQRQTVNAMEGGAWKTRQEREREARARVLLAELVPDYLAAAAAVNKPSTVDLRREVFRRVITPLLGKVAVAELGRRHFDDLKAHLRARGVVKPTSINIHLNALAALLAYAERREIIPAAPRVRRLPEGSRELENILDPDQLEALLGAAAEEPLWYAMALAAGDAGLRRGELRGLDWRNVELDGKPPVIWVRVQRSRKHEGTPKSGRARMVPISDRVVTALRALGPKPAGSVFPVKEDGMHRAFRRLCKRAGVAPREGQSWHTLRHTAITGWLRAGADLDIVRRWAGHSSIVVTQRYLHALDRDHAAALALVNARTARVPAGAIGTESRMGSGVAGAAGASYKSGPAGQISTGVLLTSEITPEDHAGSQQDQTRPRSLSIDLESFARVPSAYLGEAAAFAWLERLELAELGGAA